MLNPPALPDAAPQPGTSEGLPPRPIVGALADSAIVVALWSFAVAQPVLYQWGSHASFLHDMGVVNGALWLAIVILSLAPPLVLCLPVLVLARFRPAWAAWVFRILQGGIAGLLILQLTRQWLLLGTGIAVVAGSAGLVLAVKRFRPVRQFLVVAALGVVVFPAMFVSLSAVYPLAVPQDFRRALDRGPQATPAKNPVPVVMIVFDEFSGTSLWTADREIDGKLFPNFAQLAREGLWFRNATSVHAETSSAIPALLSGTYPPTDPTTIYQPGDALFSMLIDEQGYDGLILEPVTRLCTTPRLEEISTAVPKSPRWEDFIVTSLLAYTIQVVPVEVSNSYVDLPKLPRVWYGVYDRPIDRDATRGVIRYSWDTIRDRQLQHFVHGLTPSERPTLYFQHVIVPHRPYSMDRFGNHYHHSSTWEFPRPQDITGAEPDAAHAKNVYPDDRLFTAQAQLRYRWQVEYADRFIGQVRERLLAQGLYDKCLLIVVADHGVSHRPRGQHRFVTNENQLDLASVPLFVKPPGSRRGKVVDTPVETIDVLPTVVDVLQIADGPPTDGQSLLSPRYRPRPSKRIAYGRHLRVLPADYPAGIPRSEFPLLSSEIEDVIRAEVGRQELLGRMNGEFPQEPPSIGLAENLGTQDKPIWVPDTGLVFVGRLDQKFVGRPVTLALTLDGRIVSVTRTFRDEPEADWFQFIVPPEDHPQSANRFGIYEVGTGPKPMLRRLNPF